MDNSTIREGTIGLLSGFVCISTDVKRPLTYIIFNVPITLGTIIVLRRLYIVYDREQNTKPTVVKQCHRNRFPCYSKMRFVLRWV